MAKFNTGQSFADGDTVTGAKLNNITSQLNIYTGVISEQTAMVATVSTADQLLIADTDNGDSGSANRVTVQKLLNDTLTNGTYTNANLTGATITTGTIATLNSTTGTITTGVIPTLTSITKITSGTGTAAAPAISPTGDTNTGIYFPSADALALATNGTQRVLVNSEGATSFGKNITIAQTASDYNAVTLDNTSGVQVQLNANGNSEGNLRTVTNHPLSFTTNNTEKMRIDTSGNVGIGTASPTTKLNVYDSSSASVLVQGDSVAQTIINRASTDATAPQLALRKSRGSVASPTAVASADALGLLNFQGFGGTNNRNLARISGNVETYVSDGDISANLIFLTSSTGGVTPTERLRIGPSGQIGIGGATYGTSGQVLTSGGAAAAPSWSDVTLGTNSVTFPMLSTSSTEADNAAKRVAKAWVNFNGNGTVAIRGSLNVSSITDNAAGNYTANFTVAMSDANYAVAGAVGDQIYGLNFILIGPTALTAGSCTFGGLIQGTRYDDSSYMHLIVFR
jgi:hypothetical protein